MAHHLCPPHHLAICGRDLVLLDTRSGRYSLIANAAEALERDGRCLEIQDEDLLAILTAGGVVGDVPAPGPRPTIPPLPTRSALLANSPTIGVGDAIGLGAAWLAVGRGFAERSFTQVITQAGPAPQAAPCATRRMIRMAQAFDRLSPWIPWQGECLFRCALLLRRLQDAGERPLWVFGVRTWPFTAHCWLQADEVVLTDYAEALTVFSPILAV